MVPRGMEDDGFIRHHVQLLFQRFKICRAADFGAIGCLEDKVAEAEIVQHELPEIVQQPG